MASRWSAGSGRLLNMAPWTQFIDLQGQPAPSREVDHLTIRNVTGAFRTFGTLRGNPGDTLHGFHIPGKYQRHADGRTSPLWDRWRISESKISR